MLHPIYSTVLGHPGLVLDHAANYGALVREEIQAASRGIIARAIAGALAAVSAILALIFAGIAVMLGAVHDSFHWALVIVPGVAIVVAAIAGYIAARPTHFHAFADLRAQLQADAQALHDAGARRHD